MDIKSKKYSTTAVTVIVFLICIVFFIASLVGVVLASQSIDRLDYPVQLADLLSDTDYEHSRAFQQDFINQYADIWNLLDYYKSEEYVKGGGTISPDRMESAIRELYYDNYDWSSDEDFNAPGVRERFMKEHEAEIQQKKEAMIREELSSFQQRQKALSRQTGFTYYAADGVYTLTNLPIAEGDAPLNTGTFTGKPAWLIHENGQITAAPEFKVQNGMKQSIEEILTGSYLLKESPGQKVYFAFDRQYIEAKEDHFEDARDGFLLWGSLALAGGVISLAALIFLFAVTGRKGEDGERRLYGIDRIFTEIRLIIIALTFGFGGYGFFALIFHTVNFGYYYNDGIYQIAGGSNLFYLFAACLFGLAAAALGLLFILSVVRSIKAGRFWKGSLIVRLVMAVVNGILAIYRGGGVMRKIVLITLCICLLSATVVLAPVVFLLILIFAPRWVKKYQEIVKGVEEVRNGNLAYKIPLSGDGELDRLAESINEISQASNLAIQNELKSQRMKAELLSNVSHDLKTPLTSIITYVDLLKKEGLDSADAPRYVEVLEQKSQRLKKLTEDLFDAAKASSGAIPVSLSQVDLLSLINQGLGEMAAGIGASGLTFNLSAPNENYLVNADGQLLWRVVENLLSNVLKYAQEGTRVYIDLSERGGTNGKDPVVVLEIKNMSRAALNIGPDELMERFTRGDEARATEGSGLGLAIAKDLIKLQGGWFEVRIDGDLFKAVVMLPKAGEEPAA